MLRGELLTMPVWACVHFSDSGPLVEDALKEAGLEGVQVSRVEVSQCRETSDLLNEVARELDFPDYFGSNLDALEECLHDLSWQTADKGRVLVLDGISHHWQNHPRFIGALIEIWLGVAQATSRRGFAFHLILLW